MEEEIQGTDVILEIRSPYGFNATHYYAKLHSWDYESYTLKDRLTREQAGRLNKRHGCKPGSMGAYWAGQVYRGFDGPYDAIMEALSVWKDKYPHATRLVLGKPAYVDHEGVLDTR